MIFHVEVTVEDDPAQQRRPAAGSSTAGGNANVTYTGGAGTVQPSALSAAGTALAEPEEAPSSSSARVDATETTGRNDPCWCGSGKKFKKCHGA